VQEDTWARFALLSANGGTALAKLPSGPAIQSDGSFLGRSFCLENYRQKHRQKILRARLAFGDSNVQPRRSKGLAEAVARLTMGCG
jgi:hypothetical protein